MKPLYDNPYGANYRYECIGHVDGYDIYYCEDMEFYSATNDGLHAPIALFPSGRRGAEAIESVYTYCEARRKLLS